MVQKLLFLGLVRFWIGHVVAYGYIETGLSEFWYGPQIRIGLVLSNSEMRIEFVDY